jgi:hypothetical protein
MVAHRRAVTDALLVMLRATTTPDARPLRIGDHRAPEPAEDEETPETPFAVLRSIGGPELTGSAWANPHTDARNDYRLTSVGDNRRSAEALADAIRDAILGVGANGYTKAITPTGAHVIDREMLTAGPATQEGVWWNVADDYSLRATSA